MPSVYAAALPGDSAEGKLLHDANCMGCHDTGVYTRQDHRVRSLGALQNKLLIFYSLYLTLREKFIFCYYLIIEKVVG